MAWTRSSGRIREALPSKEELAARKPAKVYRRPQNHPDFLFVERSLVDNPPAAGFYRCSVCFNDFRSFEMRKGARGKPSRLVCHPCANHMARKNKGLPDIPRERDEFGNLKALHERACYKCKRLKPLEEFQLVAPIEILARQCIGCRTDRREHYMQNPDRLRLIAHAGGRCQYPGCYREEQLAVDHCHETGRIRGVLCRPHNIALGILGDDHNVIAHIAEYLGLSGCP